MYIFSFIFMMACAGKGTDTSTGENPEPTVQPEAAEPEAAEPETQPDTASEPEAPQPTSEPQGDVANGESLVTSRCMTCHGGNPAIENSANMTDDELRDLFANGEGNMPPVNLTDSEFLDVVAYLRATYGGGQ